jgi:hypothetical protein
MGTLHSFACMIESLGCLAGFITGLVRLDIWPPLWYVSAIMFFIFPFVNEALLIIKEKIFRTRV